MPVRNASETIDGAVGSIVEQTLRSWELIIVDDGSTDASPELAKIWAQRDPRIRLERSPAPGIVPALNHGLACSGGQYVARMDADDVSAPTRLERQAALLNSERDVTVVSCLVGYGGDASSSAGYALHVEWINGLIAPEQIALNRFIDAPVAHPSVMFRRSAVERFGGYREGAFPEDYELWLRWAAAGAKFAKIPERLLTWNDSPSRLSRTSSRYSPDAFFQIKAAYIVAAVREIFRRTGKTRPIFVWGGGRPTRKRAAFLEGEGLSLAGYIDIDPKKARGRLGGHGAPILLPENLPPPDQAFVLTYVANRGARDLIRQWLAGVGYLEGRDFVVCA
jgi:glycosyltransferase involved in cell wall biosynthesis